MDAKLTLSINKEIARKAKLYARSRGRSLSDVVENYLMFLTGEKSSEPADISPVVKALLGSVNIPDDFDYKREITEYLTNKYFVE